MGAVTEEAKRGLALLRALPPLDAWWLVVDVMARTVLPLTLEQLPAQYSLDLLRQNAQPLAGIAARLRGLEPLPRSVAQLVPLLRQAAPLTLSRFLNSFERALECPGDAFDSGPLRMALCRWPGTSWSGHFLDASGEVWASCATLEAIAALGGGRS